MDPELKNWAALDIVTPLRPIRIFKEFGMTELECGEAREAYNSPYEERKALDLSSSIHRNSACPDWGHKSMQCRVKRYLVRGASVDSLAMETFDSVCATCRSYEAVYAFNMSPKGIVPSRAALYRVS